MTDYGANVARFLQEYRDARGLTNRALAYDMGMHPSSLAYWTTGRAKVDGLAFVARLSEVSGTPIADIVGLSPASDTTLNPKED